MKIDRVGAICDLWCHAYYSFLPTSLSVWQQTSDMIEVACDLGMDMAGLQERMLDSLDKHPAHLVPVSSYHRYEAARWLQSLATSQGWPLCPRFYEDLQRLENSEVKPWVFKTYKRGHTCHVILLEEQLGQLTRGSTGLISWQGASCLLDWAEWSARLDNNTVLELGEVERDFKESLYNFLYLFD